jgi:glyoxylase-like metal-dependent hydrolase (beta-lactamase superfamily II)
MQQIERGILYEDSYLGVTVGGLVFPHGTIMIDAPLRLEDGRIWNSILFNQRRGSNRLLVLLDAHPDRTLGARTMECTILAHQQAAEIFRNRPMIFKGLNAESGALWETYSEAIGMRWTVPDITFLERMVLHWGGPDIILEHRPGPSAGAVWVIIPELQIIFVGDAIAVDQPVFLAEADMEAWLAALDELKNTYKDYKIISGRGGMVDLVAIRTQMRYLKRIIKGLERLSARSAAPDATSKMVKSLLRGLDYPPEYHDLYAQRLRYGLYHYYLRQYNNSADHKSSDGDGN